MKVKVNKDVCIGCGACTAICPDVFEFSDEGFAKAVNETVPEGTEEEVKDAAEGCPTGAIETNE